jgi:hypothetical protein
VCTDTVDFYVPVDVRAWIKSSVSPHANTQYDYADNTQHPLYAAYQYPHPLSGAGTTYTVTINKTRTDSANGVLRTKSLDVEVDLEDADNTDDGLIQTGTTVIFEAIEETGSGNFVTWSGDCASCGSALTCTKIISANTSCTGEFSFGETPPTTYTLSASMSGPGTGSITASDSSINCGATCSYNYESGTAVTLSGSCDDPWTFTEWGGSCAGTNASTDCELTMSEEKTASIICSGKWIGKQ